MDSEDYIVLYVNKKTYHVPLTFLDKHPGGRESILKKKNQDCSQDFNFHRRNGKLEWEKYRVYNEDEKNKCTIC